MSEGYFDIAHFEFIKDLNCQEIDLSGGWGNDYLVPEENFNELQARLSLLSCKSYRIDGDDTMYSAARFCKLCASTENLHVLRAGKDDSIITFYGFPQELYHLTAMTSLQPDKTKEILKIYLNKLHKDLENKCLEGLTDSKEVEWEGRYSIGTRTEGKIENEISGLFSFLKDLERAAKKFEVPEPWYSDNYGFRLCSKHHNQEYLSKIKQDFTKKEIALFKTYNIELQEQEVDVNFKEKKIFTLENR
ncbi:hypothetical protein ES705_11540 [subsurface metagenome]